MVLYIEYVILNNFIVDYLLITLLKMTKGENYRIVNQFFAICIALCVSLVFPYLYRFECVLMVLKTLSLALMILPLKRYKNIKEFILTYFIILAYTFLIGGVIMGLINLLNIKYTISGFIINNFEFPSGVFIVIVATTLYLIIATIKYVFDYKKIEKNFYDISLSFLNKNYSIKAYLDTGNFSTCEDKGIVYISKNIYVDMMSVGVLKNTIHKKVNISSINDTKEIDVFYLDNIMVNNKCFNLVPCAVSSTRFNNFDCLLHSDYV